jgi:hypothetical protein
MASNFLTPYAEFDTHRGVLKDDNGLLLMTFGTAAPVNGAGLVAEGCLAVDATAGDLYCNSGTTAIPVWGKVGP